MEAQTAAAQPSSPLLTVPTSSKSDSIDQFNFEEEKQSLSGKLIFLFLLL